MANNGMSYKRQRWHEMKWEEEAEQKAKGKEEKGDTQTERESDGEGRRDVIIIASTDKLCIKV